MPAESLADREADAVRALSKRLGILRRVLLVPLALLSAATCVPAYVLFRDMQMNAQWDAGAETAYHVPLLTGLLAMIPAAVFFAASALLYRAVRDRRLRAWKLELCRELELPDGHLDEIGRIFH